MAQNNIRRNFQHLTGLELIDVDGNVLRGQSENFYRKCVENKLSTDELQFKADGTTHLKLGALPTFMDVTKITKIAGEYNNVRPYLFVDKVIGGVNFCLGLKKEDIGYVPSSALLEDIKKLTDAPSQVLAILRKDIEQEIYKEVKYVTKGLNLNKIYLPDEITEIINLANYVYKGK
ncbi:MAG: PBECR4 domain-containing protein [Lachnospiraceae bacterium]